ncbi:tyrosine-type recombinase/integrase [Sodalis glossinidius]
MQDMRNFLRKHSPLDFGKLTRHLTWERNPPPFHEIRSLAARLYTDEKGRDYAQKLLGHKSSEMTDKYRDVRGSEWAEIE